MYRRDKKAASSSYSSNPFQDLDTIATNLHKKPADGGDTKGIVERELPKAAVGSKLTTSASIAEIKSTNSPSQPSKVSYNMLWREKSQKKHKTWKGDGVVYVENQVLKAYVASRCIGSTKFGGELEPGTGLFVGNYEIEIESVRKTNKNVSSDEDRNQDKSLDRDSAKRRLLSSASPTRSKHLSSPVFGELETSVRVATPPVKKLKSGNDTTSETEKIETTHRLTRRKLSEDFIFDQFKPPSAKVDTAAANSSIYLNSSQNASESKIDSFLHPRLRPHQIEGVSFLLECVLGARHNLGYGAILADDMGLGKTLMAITLIYSLIKRGRIKNALIVCPVSLLSNWKNEFKKWLGESRLGVQVVSQDAKPELFFRDRQHKTYQVMIAGYERMHKIVTMMKQTNVKEFDLVVCDEGHRLKSATSKLASCISEVVGDKRVILTGTPVQNNLQEFWALSEFVNPGCLGTAAKFSRYYADAISAGREPDASPQVIDLSRERAEELGEVTAQFLLRRDHSVLEKYLSVTKSEVVLFCSPSPEQVRLYRSLLNSTDVSCCLYGDMSLGADNAQFLRAISLLKQAANSVNLVSTENRRPVNLLASSTKLQVLNSLLARLYETTDEKVVVVSGSTKMLDLCQQLCISNRMQWLRLDGQTPQDRRQGMVDIFNKSDQKRAFVFLLSARSGGVGLNLIGGSRLVLMDLDWNPAIDSQAMARIHRDGQKRSTYIYRLISCGLIDEKIFQRQLTKLGLSDSVLTTSIEEDSFTKAELRDLFSMSNPGTCNTLELAQNKNYIEWREVDDPILADTMAETEITCIMRKT